MSAQQPSSSVGAGSFVVGASAAPFPHVLGRFILIQNDPSNTPDLLVGNSATQPVRVLSGQSITVEVDNLSVFWGKSSGGNITINYLVLA